MQEAEDDPENPPAPLLDSPQLEPHESVLLEAFLDLHNTRQHSADALGFYPMPISAESILAYYVMRPLPVGAYRFFELVRMMDSVFLERAGTTRKHAHGHRHIRSRH